MNLDALSREFRREQDTSLSEQRRLELRRRVLETPAPKKWNVRWLLPALVVGVVALIAWRPSTETPLTFAVAGEPGTREAFVSAPLSTSTPLTFSDGSRVELARGSSARVNALTSRGATLRLEHGHANVHVIHREQTDWQIEAGPYAVHVVGTRFAIRWDARTAELDVAMHEGRVIVEGPDGYRTSLEGQERLHREGHERVRAAQPHVEEEPSDEAQEEHIAPVEPVTPNARPDWQRIARQGRHTDAAQRIRVAELWRESEDDVRLAANTLRRAGDRRENAAWRVLHRRFGDRDAAFHLGRNAFHTSAEDAERWLSTYLSRPGGQYEREARGRLLELLRRRNDPRLPREAQTYLERFPDGPHAELARAVTSP